MAKTYAKAGLDVTRRIEKLREAHHPELEHVTIGALFVFDDDSPQHVLEHQGYPAAAVARITPPRDRAAGLDDAMIIVDRYTYSGFEAKQMNALLDHELQHFDRVLDKKTGRPKCDAIGRPKLAIRKHDRSFGWFDEIARRHGIHSIEVMQAQTLIRATGQLYFEFETDAA